MSVLYIILILIAVSAAAATLSYYSYQKKEKIIEEVSRRSSMLKTRKSLVIKAPKKRSIFNLDIKKSKETIIPENKFMKDMLEE